MKLRDYQEADLVRLREAMRSSWRVLYVAPTGSGKTVLFARIAEGAAVKGKRVVVLVHRIELVRQTVAKLEAFGVPAGLVTAQATARLEVELLRTGRTRMATLLIEQALVAEQDRAKLPVRRGRRARA
jgi:superfamily II DNA or RNA helicase